MFYDRIYGNLLIDNQLNLPPYSSGAGGGSVPAEPGEHAPRSRWLPARRRCNADSALYPDAAISTVGALGRRCTGEATVIGSGSCIVSSGLGYTEDAAQMANRLPLTQEYSLDLQYEFAHGWVADVGYVGSHGIHLYNYSQDINLAHLVAGAPNVRPLTGHIQGESKWSPRSRCRPERSGQSKSAPLRSTRWRAPPTR